MMFSAFDRFLQDFNVAILPIIIIPVTGLCCLVFANRLAALNSVVYAIQKELHAFLNKGQITREEQEVVMTLREARKKLLGRANMIRWAMICCFSGIVAFVLSAISIMLSTLEPNLTLITLVLWIIGALLFAVGLIAAIIEIKSQTLSTVMLESDLIDKWLSHKQI